MLKNSKLKIIILTILLFLVSFIYIIIKGNTYVIEMPIDSKNNKIDDIIIEIDHKIIKCTDKKIKDDNLIVQFKAIKKEKHL